MHKQAQADNVMVKESKREFAAADKNSDGKLSFAEYARGMGQEAAMDGELPGDKDKDGQLSLSEYVTMFDLPTATDDEHKPTDEEKKEHAEHSAQIKVRAQPLRIVTRCAARGSASAVLLQ